MFKSGGQFVARADLQLAVGIGQVQLHSPQSHEQRLRDLLITDTAGGQLGDPALAGGKRVGTGACPPSGPPAGGAQLV